MPSLQLDAPAARDPETFRALARRLGATYAAIMDTPPETITVVLREASVWRCTAGEPQPAALLMCDIRRGRPVETRADLAQALIAICRDAIGVEPKVEFTQHAGDEMFHPHLGGFNREWTPGE
jgi:hypothetical protein